MSLYKIFPRKYSKSHEAPKARHKETEAADFRFSILIFRGTDQRPITAGTVPCVWKEFNHILPMSAMNLKGIVNYIMTENSDGIDLDDADLNGDGKVNVVDLVLLINKMK
jgi:hypothetical protein